MINIYFKSNNSRRFEKIDNAKIGAWINIENATKEDIKYVSQITGLSVPDLDDALDPSELPRIEKHSTNVIVFIRSPKKSDIIEELLHTHPLTIIISDKYFITISITRSRTIRHILKKNVKYSTQDRNRFFIYMISKIIQRFNKQIKLVRNTVSSQKINFKHIQNQDILNLIENEEILNQYISSLVPMRNVFDAITGGAYISLTEDDTELFQDISISMKQLVDVCNVNIKSIQSLRDSYQIIFTNRLNKTMQFLASFTIMMTIPTIISSFFGMNVLVPLSNHPFGFYYIIVLTVALILLFFWIFVRNRWI